MKRTTLFVAEKLLEIISQESSLIHKTPNNQGVMTLKMNVVSQLSVGEVVYCLERLEDRKILKFEDEEDKYDVDDLTYINLYFNKDKLLEFVETARDDVYKIPTRYNGDLEYVLEFLAIVLHPRYIDKQIEFSKIGTKYMEISEWIADHSDTMMVRYTEEPDVEFEKDMKRPRVLGISRVPNSLTITDRPELETLNNKIRQLVVSPQQRRIKLLLKNKGAIYWKCANCGNWLKIKLEEEKQIESHLNDFLIKKFKICPTCRKRNYFSIDPKGTIKFLLALPPPDLPKTIKLSRS